MADTWDHPVFDLLPLLVFGAVIIWDVANAIQEVRSRQDQPAQPKTESRRYSDDSTRGNYLATRGRQDVSGNTCSESCRPRSESPGRGRTNRRRRMDYGQPQPPSCIQPHDTEAVPTPTAQDVGEWVVCTHGETADFNASQVQQCPPPRNISPWSWVDDNLGTLAEVTTSASGQGAASTRLPPREMATMKRRESRNGGEEGEAGDCP